MSVNKTYLENEIKRHRPLGVWILTIFTLLYTGVYQLHPTTMLNLFRGQTAMYSEDSVKILFVYTFLEIIVVLVSILTWSGLEIGRKTFVFFVALYFLGDGISNFRWGTVIPDLNDSKALVWYITDFAFPLLCIWYFNKPLVKEFFRSGKKI